MLLAFLTVVPLSWRKPTAAVGCAFTLYISFGVPVLNYHYPSDVLAGWLLALGWYFALLALQRGVGLSPVLNRTSRPNARGSYGETHDAPG